MEFEHVFRSLILKRGYDYYVNDLVEDLEIGQEKIKATVMGTENYSVSIQRRGEQIEQFYCDCPYFKSGDNCKHLAAVLYTVNELEKRPSRDVRTTGDLDMVMELLDSLSHKELLEFFTEELTTDSDLRFRFNTRFHHKRVCIDGESYVSYIDTVFEQHLGYERFIDYKKIGYFQMDVGKVITSIQGLADDGEHFVAFTLIKYLVKRLEDVDIDDSLGTLTSLMADIMDILDTIINDSSEQVYNMVFQWVWTKINGPIDLFEDDFFDVFKNYFRDEDKLREKIEIIDEILENLEEPIIDIWSIGHWRFSRFLTLKIEILKDLDEHEHREELVQKYICLPEIRTMVIKGHIEKKELDQAIHYLVEGKELYKMWPGIVDDYSSQLIELYRLTENHRELLNECRRRLLEYTPNSLTTYREYKGLFSHDDWKKERDTILCKLKETFCDIKVYYAEEGLLEELFAEIKKDPNYRGLDTYEHLLYQEFTEELASLLVKKVEEMALHSRGRKYYRQIREELGRLEKYPEGEELVSELKKKWRIQYKNRPAMMEELGM